MNQYYIFGLQRSGTNFLEKLFLENFKVESKNVKDVKKLSNRTNYPDFWKHNIDHCESITPNIPVIVVYKNPYLWIESLCFRNCADWVKRQKRYHSKSGPKEFMAGKNKLNVKILAQAYKDWCETWLDKNYTEIKYEDLLVEESLIEILDTIEPLFSTNINNYVTQTKKVPQSKTFNQSHKDYYLNGRPAHLNQVQINAITETLGKDLINRLGY